MNAIRFRQSALKVWQTCPLQARFAMLDRLPQKTNGKTVFGTCIHDALALYNVDGDLDAAISRFKETWHDPSILHATIDYWPKYTSYGSLRERGIEILKEYHSTVRWENRTVIAVEHQFLVPFGRHELTGTVDLIEVRRANNGREALRIVDYKTSSRQPSFDQLNMDVQFSCYVYASLQPEFWVGSDEMPGLPYGWDLYHRFKDMDRAPIWYHLWTNKEIFAGLRDDGAYMRLYRLCNEIERALEQGVFVPNISGDSCPLCSYTEECGIEIPERVDISETLF